MEPLGTFPFSYFSCSYVRLSCQLSVPAYGEVTRCGAVARHSKLPVNGIIGTVIIERAIDLILLLITGITVLLNFGLLNSHFTIRLTAYSNSNHWALPGTFGCLLLPLVDSSPCGGTVAS